MEDINQTSTSDTQGDKLKSILKKYNHKRRLKKTTSSWQGPSHKKFGDYFNPLLDSSSEEASLSDNEDNKRSDSDDSESLIFSTTKIPVVQKVLPTHIWSDSEPDDPEELRIHQERLRARQSRINLSAMSTTNRFQSNRTMNATQNKSKFIPSRLSDMPPDLLNPSSSSDEEGIECNQVPLVMKESDPEEIVNVSFSKRLSKRKSEDISILKESGLSPIKEGNASSPSKFSRSAKEATTPTTNVKKTSPFNRSSVILATLVSSNSVKKPQSKRVSTPKPKDLVSSSKILTRSNRRSKMLSSNASEFHKLNAQDGGSPVLKRMSRSLQGTPLNTPKSSPRKSLQGTPLNTPKSSPRKSPKKSPAKSLSESLSKTSTPRKNRSKSPSFESTVLDLNEGFGSNLDVAASSMFKDVANEEELVTTSKSKSSRKSTPKISKARQSKGKYSQGEPLNSQQRIRRSSRVSARTPGISSPSKMSAKSPLQHLTESSSKNPFPSGYSNHRLPILPLLDNQQVASIISTAECPTDIRFMVSSRPAGLNDPVQYSLLHESSTLSIVLWKLLPHMVNYCRTRGEACVLVLKGEIELDGQKFLRGNVMTLSSGLTYCISNCTDQFDAIYQVTEYF